MAFIIIMITLIYASLGSLTQTNFTGIGNQPGYFWYFFLWTFITASYFFYSSVVLFKKYFYTFKGQRLLSLYIYIACVVTPLIPYTQTQPFLDDLHVFFAMSSSVSFLGIWLVFLSHIKQRYPSISQKIEIPFWMLIQTLIICLLYFSCINSIIEVLLVVSMIILIEFLKKI